MTPVTKDTAKETPRLTTQGAPKDVPVKIGSTGDTVSRPPAQLLRRVPRQERGRERVEKILDAAATVIAEIGVDAMTTNAIALRARTSVGSLYQFFPNKRAIVEALAARYNAELRRINDDAMSSQATLLSLPELVERVVVPLLFFHETNPAYRHVYHAMNGPDGPSCGEAELHKAVVARLEDIIRSHAPEMSEDRRHVHATVAVLTVHALLGFAMTASPTMRDRIVQELRELIVSYIQTAINHPIVNQRSAQETRAHAPSARGTAQTIPEENMAIDNGFAEA